MKHLLHRFIAIILVSGSASASATWTQVSDSDTAAIFINREKPQRVSPSIIHHWVLHDYKGAKMHGFGSTLYLQETDCAMNRYRALKSVVFEQRMGEGEIAGISTIPPSRWSVGQPGSAGERIVRIMCGR